MGIKIPKTENIDVVYNDLKNNRVLVITETTGINRRYKLYEMKGDGYELLKTKNTPLFPEYPITR